jgi:hypothetical protein
MRINKRDPVPVPHVRINHIFDQGGFAGPGFPDDVNMRPPVLFFDAEKFPDVVIIGNRENGDPFWVLVCFIHEDSIKAGKDAEKGGVCDGCVNKERYSYIY